MIEVAKTFFGAFAVVAYLVAGAVTVVALIANHHPIAAVLVFAALAASVITLATHLPA